MWWSDYWPMPGMFFGPVLMFLFVIACMAMMAFAGLRALRNLDLQFFRIDQVVAGDAKTSGSHLLDRAIARVAVVIHKVARGVLSAFARIALSADAVHGNCQSFVCFLAD